MLCLLFLTHAITHVLVAGRELSSSARFVMSAGTFKLAVYVTDQFGAQSIASTEVTVLPFPRLNLSTAELYVQREQAALDEGAPCICDCPCPTPTSSSGGPA